MLEWLTTSGRSVQSVKLRLVPERGKIEDVGVSAEYPFQ